MSQFADFQMKHSNLEYLYLCAAIVQSHQKLFSTIKPVPCQNSMDKQYIIFAGKWATKPFLFTEVNKISRASDGNIDKSIVFKSMSISWTFKSFLL